jgi:hypothetical protein
MFERFTDRARYAVVLSQESARRLNSESIGTEHLLLGIVSEGAGMGVRSLGLIGFDITNLPSEIEAVAPPGGGSPSGHVPFTKDAKKVLEFSLRESLTPSSFPRSGASNDPRAVHADAGRSVAITTNTAETARRINIEIQRQTNPRPRPRPCRPGGRHPSRPGDRIATRRNQPALRTTDGHQVRNRHTWTVESTGPDGSLTVAHPDRGAVRLPAGYVAEHVELGWAVTGYGNQGDTVDVGLAVLEPGTTRNHAYVAMTRGRHRNLAFLTDPTGTAHAGDLLTSIVERTPRHDSALAVDEALHRQAGPTAPDRPVVPAATPPAPDRVDQIRARLDRLQRRPPPDRSRGL